MLLECWVLELLALLQTVQPHTISWLLTIDVSLLTLQVGGLGDVVTSLARAVQEEGHLVEVILPR